MINSRDGQTGARITERRCITQVICAGSTSPGAPHKSNTKYTYPGDAVNRVSAAMRGLYVNRIPRRGTVGDKKWPCPTALSVRSGQRGSRMTGHLEYESFRRWWYIVWLLVKRRFAGDAERLTGGWRCFSRDAVMGVLSKGRVRIVL